MRAKYLQQRGTMGGEYVQQREECEESTSSNEGKWEEQRSEARGNGRKVPALGVFINGQFTGNDDGGGNGGADGGGSSGDDGDDGDDDGGWR